MTYGSVKRISNDTSGDFHSSYVFENYVGCLRQTTLNICLIAFVFRYRTSNVLVLLTQ